MAILDTPHVNRLSAQTLPALRFATLSLAVLIIIALRLEIHKGGLSENARITYSRSAKVEWFEQSPVSDSQTPISNKVWQLEFIQIENVLWRAKLDSDGSLAINPATLELLEQVHSLLPSVITNAELDRLTFLVEKSMPSISGEQLAKLINSYIIYTQVTQSRLSAYQQADLAQKLSILKLRAGDNKQLQIQLFGKEIAAKLFREKNLTIDYLDQRLMVNMSASLDSEEKKARLAALQDSYKTSLLKIQQ